VWRLEHSQVGQASCGLTVGELFNPSEPQSPTLHQIRLTPALRARHGGEGTWDSRKSCQMPFYGTGLLG
jgi:hypothetical protein